MEDHIDAEIVVQSKKDIEDIGPVSLEDLDRAMVLSNTRELSISGVWPLRELKLSDLDRSGKRGSEKTT